MFFKKDTCPVCNSKMVENKKVSEFDKDVVMTTKYCINNCFKYRCHHNKKELILESFYVFGQKTDIPSFAHKKTRQKRRKTVKEQINYWKENERYLVKIMGG